LIYDSLDSLKQFEPAYRQVRYGFATKVEKPSRQQRTFPMSSIHPTTSTDETFEIQASSARTSRRSFVVPPRSRVPRRRRTTKRCPIKVFLVWALRCCFFCNHNDRIAKICQMRYPAGLQKFGSLIFTTKCMEILVSQWFHICVQNAMAMTPYKSFLSRGFAVH
jgi:hypothetical protein